MELMDEYKGENPEAAEAAYLSAIENNRPSQINETLQLRHGTGQGYAKFKDDLEEMTGKEIDDHRGFAFVDEEGSDTSLENVTAEDVGIDADEVIRNSFWEVIEPEIREEVENNLGDLSEDSQTVAGILRKGYDVEIWEEEPNQSSVWHTYSLTSENILTDNQKNARVEELVEAGVLYYKRHTSPGVLTPMFRNLENPFKHLPDIQTVNRGE